MLIEIKRWDNGKVIHQIEADDLGAAVKLLVAQSADLRSADLRYANLQSADLQSANLRSANLRSADLRYANLQYADLRSADLRSADLRSADLQYADLQSADLRYANLRSADLQSALNLRLPTGETWVEYLTETVPALLTAAGKPLDSFTEHFQCHEWNNCPMAHAFDVHELNEVPILFRPRAEQFIQFFDANQIPWPLPTLEELKAQQKKAAAERATVSAKDAN